MPTKYFHRGALALHYEHAGETTLPGAPPRMDRGAVLLFVHGAGGNGRLWSRQMQRFGERHAPLALDLPAHGRSGGLDGPPSVAAAAQVVADFLEGLGAPPVIAVGHGLGGQIVLALALDHAPRVRAVVTIGTSAAPPALDGEIATLRDVVRGRRPQSFDTPLFSSKPDMGIVREVWGEIVKTDPRVRLQDLEGYAASDLRPRLGAISVPARILHGSEDRYCDPSCADELAAAIPSARVGKIEGAGHVAQVEQPERVGEAIEELLR